MIPPKCSCELNSSLPLNRSLKILDTILNYLVFNLVQTGPQRRIAKCRKAVSALGFL